MGLPLSLQALMNLLCGGNSPLLVLVIHLGQSVVHLGQSVVLLGLSVAAPLVFVVLSEDTVLIRPHLRVFVGQ